jgi:hypothetical protein
MVGNVKHVHTTGWFVYKAYLEGVVACNDSMATGPVRECVVEVCHLSCHEFAHPRATAAHVQQDCDQKGSEAAVPITWTGQT